VEKIEAYVLFYQRKPSSPNTYKEKTQILKIIESNKTNKQVHNFNYNNFNDNSNQHK